MAISAGSRIGPYEITSRIGAGGMGEVWQATDTRLGRNVAIKFLPPDFAANPHLTARFEREARTISQLSHPNICTLHDVGRSEGHSYLVMELLEGESLEDRLKRGPLPLSEVLRIGRQISEALDRAHRSGVVHRDLKPGNVMLTRSGAKLLDFGISKSIPFATTTDDETLDDETAHKPLTEEGTLIGTPQYMAPEQIAGEQTDHRTDIFALGLVLYEMATGERAFQGATRTSLIAAIVGKDPRPVRELQPLTPPVLEHVIARCLAKDPDDRWQSAHDIAAELAWISEAGEDANVTLSQSPPDRGRKTRGWIVPLIAAALAAAITWALIREEPATRNVIESSIEMPAGTRLSLIGGLAISPDGTMIATALDDMQGSRSLWVRPLASSTFRRIEGTSDAAYPFWSPDSSEIAFFAAGQLKRVSASGGPVQMIAPAPGGRGGAWGADGTIVFAPTIEGPLMKVDATGGDPVPATRLAPGETAHRWPAFLPDGERFLYVGMANPGTGSGIHLGSLDDEEMRETVSDVSSSMAVADGHLFYSRDGALVMQKFDEDSATVSGSVMRVLDGVALSERISALFSVARDGTVLAQRGIGFVNSQLVWADREGNELEAITGMDLFFSPKLSRDGRRLAVDRSNPISGQGDIWVYDLDRNVPTRITFQQENESAPAWSPDDRHLYFHRGVQGASYIERTSAGGTGEVETLFASPAEKRLTHVSSDGNRILFDVLTGTLSDIWLHSVAEGTTKPWLATPFNERGAELSPDGRWIVYQSDESGRNEIYVRGFPDSERKWRITDGGGIMPSWRADGREIFYIAPDRRMMSIPVDPNEQMFAGSPVALFDAGVRSHPVRQYDVTPDGQRFVLNRAGTTSIPPLTLVVRKMMKSEE
ncbi:MAG: protein kinase [Acidobacteria bacterium]|nr:protein kinase [Acidobacteriota bacterium]